MSNPVRARPLVHVALSPRVLSEALAVALREQDLEVVTGPDIDLTRTIDLTLTDTDETLTSGGIVDPVVVVDLMGKVRWRRGAEDQPQELPGHAGLPELLVLVVALLAEQGRGAGYDQLEGGSDPGSRGEAEVALLRPHQLAGDV